MNHLIVYAHPNPESFNHAILQTLAQALESCGHEVRVRDLYVLGFNPVLSKADFDTLAAGETPQDMKEEQEHVAWADVITFIGPLWWGTFPAIAKGYMDRVLSDGFAYTGDENGPRGLLTKKKVYTIMTGDAPHHVYEQSGLFKSINQIFDSIMCQFCALEVAGHTFFMGVNAASHDERTAMLEEVKKIATEL